MSKDLNSVIDEMHNKLEGFSNKQPKENYMTYLHYAHDIMEDYTALEKSDEQTARTLCERVLAQIATYDMMYEL